MNMPWQMEPLDKWAICGMNHYHINGERRLFVSMNRKLYAKEVEAQYMADYKAESLKRQIEEGERQLLKRQQHVAHSEQEVTELQGKLTEMDGIIKASLGDLTKEPKTATGRNMMSERAELIQSLEYHKRLLQECKSELKSTTDWVNKLKGEACPAPAPAPEQQNT